MKWLTSTEFLPDINIFMFAPLLQLTFINSLTRDVLLSGTQTWSRIKLSKPTALSVQELGAQFMSSNYHVGPSQERNVLLSSTDNLCSDTNWHLFLTYSSHVTVNVICTQISIIVSVRDFTGPTDYYIYPHNYISAAAVRPSALHWSHHFLKIILQKSYCLLYWSTRLFQHGSCYVIDPHHFLSKILQKSYCLVYWPALLSQYSNGYVQCHILIPSFSQ
jgi:hypothetical protein